MFHDPNFEARGHGSNSKCSASFLFEMFFSKKGLVSEETVVGGLFSNSSFLGKDRSGVVDISCGIETHACTLLSAGCCSLILTTSPANLLASPCH